MATDDGSPHGDGMAAPPAKSGGAPNEGVIAYNEGRGMGYIEGATSMIKAAAKEGEAMQEGVGALVINRLVPQLERHFPDAQKLYPPLKLLAEGKFDD